ncbi:hypothetical protein [Dyadobacter sp. CY323]|uniref:hypothetical protein n=1 Tax=Dyadobacter sp. CY323 TaxID=2907302 RepID=UPI001F427363|nr:hypothetical protein [Dyadobacter sp. CY323]MCE6989190.1 hypothetical protein [Dyadobacter sp. CY323]
MINSAWLRSPDNRLKLLVLAFAILLLPFIALSFFTFPTTDDYCHTLTVNDMGYWAYQKHYWLTWSGRYIGTLISSTQPLTYGSYFGYKLAPAILILIYVHAFITFAKAITNNRFPAWQTTLLAFLLLFVFIAEMPSVAGYFYWYTGYYYTIADIGTLYLLSYFFRHYNTLSTRDIALLSVGIILLVGMNEYTLVWLVILSGSLFFFKSIIDKKLQSRLLILCLIALAFGILSVTAPGNAARADSGLYPTPLKYNLLFAIKNSFVWEMHNFSKMAPALCVLTLVLIPFACQLYNSKKEGEFVFLSVHPALSLLVFAGCLYLSYFPSYWSIAEPPNLRGQCVINFWTLIGWTFNVFVLTFYALKKGLITPVINLGALGWVVGLYFLSLYMSNFNYRSAWSDLLTGRAARFNKEMVARTALVLNTKEAQVTVPKLKNVPYTILIAGEEWDPAWASMEVNNGCAEWYFKKKFFYK